MKLIVAKWFVVLVGWFVLSAGVLQAQQTIVIDSLSNSSFCQNEEVTVYYSVTGGYNGGNEFTAQLSDETGSFASPTIIGSVTSITSGSIIDSIPNLTLTGTQYRVRLVSSSPAVTSADNGADLSISGSAIDPATFGSNSWNVYAYNIDMYTNVYANFDFSNYRGMYVDTNLSFNSSDYWGMTSNPSAASGYVGCSITNDRHIVQYKREGFPCAYYTVNLAGPGNSAGFDDAAVLYIDGVVVWSNTGCCQAISNVWSGYLGASSQVEFIWSENGGNSYGRITFDDTAPSGSLSPDVTICAGSSTTLKTSGADSYDWSFNSAHLVAPLTNDSVVCSPPGGTGSGVETYVVAKTDVATSCTLYDSIKVTINPLPSTSVTPTSDSHCASGTTAATASGANTYTWSPSTGVSVLSASGHEVTLTPPSTTTYKVYGSNNCATDSAEVTITIIVPAGDTSVFGTNEWNVYVFEGNNFNTYMGSYVDTDLSFDTDTKWNRNGTPSSAPGYSGCTVSTNQHSYTHKRKGFPCGYYQIDMPHHDDAVVLRVDGSTVFSQNSWSQNVAKFDVWSGYLDTDSEVELTIREYGGASNAALTFNYIFGPDNSANQTVWNGNVSSDWSNAANWCNSLPSTTISAYIPSGRPNSPQISGSATVNDLVITAGTSLSISGSNQLEVSGDWQNDGTFTANNSTVIFVGNNTDTIKGAGTNTFYNLQLNSDLSMNELWLQNDITVTNNLNLLSGIIQTNGNTLNLSNGATVSNASNSSFVAGPVQKTGNSAFTFPTGKGTFYCPITITAPANASDAFTAEYFANSPDSASPSAYSRSSMASGLNTISDVEYWILDRTAGTASVSVTLSWNGNSGVSNLGDLAVTRWNGSEWADHGNGGTTGNGSAGTLTSSAAITNFSPFTLASTTNSNTLPILLGDFTARVQQEEQVHLAWQTLTEINNDYFTLERSPNGINWEILTDVDGAGTSNKRLQYNHFDQQPLTGRSYYRLKQTDYNGDYSYSAPEMVYLGDEPASLSVYPNPAENRLTLTGSIAINQPIKIIDPMGRNLSESVTEISRNDQSLSLDVSALKAGVYVLQVGQESVAFVKR